MSSITTSKSNFSAGDIIWIRSSDMEKMAVTKKMLCWTNVISLVLLLLYSICWRSSITMQSIWRRWWREQYRQSKKLHSLCTMWHNYYVAVLATFDQQVANGFYAPLSEFIQIDFALLKQRKSGKYFFGYVWVFHQCWNAVWMVLLMVTFPFICYAHFVKFICMVQCVLSPCQNSNGQLAAIDVSHVCANLSLKSTPYHFSEIVDDFGNWTVQRNESIATHRRWKHVLKCDWERKSTSKS